jgi:DNA-binding LytR/AlgR family response regulator
VHRRPTVLIADDEPLLREDLARQLAHAWPEAEIVAQARNGREALELFDAHAPDVCFLDVQMPGVSGVAVARQVGRRAHLVFVTAYDQYAVEAFAQGVLDYLVKPVDAARLAETVTRLKERLHAARPLPDLEGLLAKLATQIDSPSAPAPLRWIRAQARQGLELIPVDSIDYLRSDTKHTLVAWRDEAGRPEEALVRTTLRELIPQLDPARFAQVHRAVVVNLGAIRRVTRGENETAEIHLRHREEVLPVSRNYLHLFRGM